MTGETVYIASQSVFAILGSLFFLLFITIIIYIYVVIKRIDEKTENLLEESRVTTIKTKEVIRSIGQAVVAFLITKVRKKRKK